MSDLIQIKDDFDLEKIRCSGQIFRMTKEETPCGESVYSVISKNRLLKIQKKPSKKMSDTFEVSCSKSEFYEVWADFFDLSRNYVELRSRLSGQNDFIDDAFDFGCGLRILRQDPWEMIVTFIISQRRSMPAIATATNKICEMFGEEREGFFSFPEPQKLAEATVADLRKCGVGYRAEYIIDAAQRVASGQLKLEECEKCSDDELFDKLCEIKGVGEKVANCIMLFGFARTSRAPVDVWIKRVIDEEFGGVNPFLNLGEDAGIVQQYMFYWKTQHKQK